MSDSINIGSRVKTFEKHDALAEYVNVELFVDDKVSVKANNLDNTEQTLTANCPWATQAVAQQVLSALKGFHYRPFNARGARLSPKAEMGDIAVIDYTGYGIYSQDSQFNSEFVSNIAAPYEEEIDHEFPYVPSADRRYQREIRTLKAELTVAAGQIEAKVSSIGGSRASFGWTLQNDNFTVFSSGKEVLRVTRSGASISGHVVATSGEIGGCVIQNGVLKINSANINSINASQITAGVLQVDRIQDLSIKSTKLASGAVTEPKISGGAITGGKIGSGAVSFAKTDSYLQGQVNQIGVNMSNIAAINKKFVTALAVVGLEVTGGGIIVRYRGKNKTFSPRAKNDSAMKYVLGAT